MDKAQLLQRVFGYDQFRPGQEALIDGVLSGRDVFGIMPTGGGKSMCYQIPALLLPGITLVVSPLISPLCPPAAERACAIKFRRCCCRESPWWSRR